MTVLSGTGLAPKMEAAGQFEGFSWITYGHVVGEPWRENTSDVANVLGQLHGSRQPISLPKGPNGSEDIATQTMFILSKCDHPQTISRLRPQGVVKPSPDLRLLHGDPVPSNIVVSPTGVTLIDWQCPHIGDPAEDLALFLSPAMQSLYRGAPLTAEEEASFLVAYSDPSHVARYHAMKTWYHWRMAAYCLWRAEQGSERDRKALDLELSALQSINPSAA